MVAPVLLLVVIFLVVVVVVAAAVVVTIGNSFFCVFVKLSNRHVNGIFAYF